MFQLVYLGPKCDFLNLVSPPLGSAGAKYDIFKCRFRKYLVLLGLEYNADELLGRGEICNKDFWKIRNSFRVIKEKRFV